MIRRAGPCHVAPCPTLRPTLRMTPANVAGRGYEALHGRMVPLHDANPAVRRDGQPVLDPTPHDQAARRGWNGRPRDRDTGHGPDDTTAKTRRTALRRLVTQGQPMTSGPDTRSSIASER